jgi:hypothetical protein
MDAAALPSEVADARASIGSGQLHGGDSITQGSFGQRKRMLPMTAELNASPTSARPKLGTQFDRDPADRSY